MASLHSTNMSRYRSRIQRVRSISAAAVNCNNLLVTVCAAAVMLTCATAAPIDDYIRRAEPRFAYHDTGVRIGGGGAAAEWDGYIFNVTTLQWLTDADSSQSIWWHYVALIVPRNVDASCDLGTLYITGGNSDPAALPTSGDEEVVIVASVSLRTRCLGAVLYQVPNTPIAFPDDPSPGKQRSPDESIAYTWWRFMRDFDAQTGAVPVAAAERILYLPMVKSAVQVLNVVQAVAPTFGVISLTRFLTGGVSKRGWSAWLLAAVDKRIVGVVPIVLDALGMQAFLHRQYRMYGAYTWAMQPYWAMNITAAVDTPAADALFAIVDPLAYAQRLERVKKFVISSGGDEFQMPDNQRFWAPQMPGELSFLVCKNADHTEQSGLLEWLPRLCAFAEAVRANLPQPRLAWSIDAATGNITITTDAEPVAMSVAVADSPQDVSAGKRDFRWAALNAQPCKVKVFGDVCFRPVLWATYPLNASSAMAAAAAAAGVWHSRRSSSSLAGAGELSVTVGMPLPPAGQFRAFMIEVAWSNTAGADDFVQTSGVSVIPNTLPFPACRGAECAGTLC